MFLKSGILIMQGKFENLVGMKFNRLTVQYLKGKKHGRAYWICRCNCGGRIELPTHRIIDKKNPTRSCGCFRKENTGNMFRTHGCTNDDTYAIWCKIKERCLNKKSTFYLNYGGRSIKLCKRWHSFENFKEDMGDRPYPTATIDRIDNNGNYEPLNCRWATMKQQANNKRNNVILEFNGISKNISQWAEYLGLKRGTLNSRIIRKWELRHALDPKKRRPATR